MTSLKLSDPSVEGKFSVSKWLKHQVLIDADEMEELCRHLSPFALFNVSEITPLSSLEVTLDQFLTSYQAYIALLKEGKTPIDRHLQRHLSCAMTTDSQMLYAQMIQPDKFMARTLKPLIQMQQHRFFASKTSGTINPMVMSRESIHWGIQFAYPQIFFNEAQGSYAKVSDERIFPNTGLFTKLVKWLRAQTVPTTFCWDEKKIASPLRLGKKCFSWIQDHPQMRAQGIGIHVY